MANAAAVTKGFLFADLRGYTAYIERHGDRAAAELLATYRTLVRAAIAEYDGAEIKTEGDSVYVVFPSASAAVEAGLVIVRSAAQASTTAGPIRVGVGIHAGETVATDEGPVGVAVNIAARVCAKAQAGEVLVTDTVRSLTRTLLRYRFVGLGPQSLKGVERGIVIYRVEAVPSGRIAHLRRYLAARRRFAASIGLGAMAVVLASGAAWFVSRPPDCLDLGPATRDVVARVDLERMCVVELVAVGRTPGAIVATESDLWVASEGTWTVTRIELSSHRPTLTIGTPGAPVSLAAHADGQVDVLTANEFDEAAPNEVVWIRDDTSSLFIVQGLPPAVAAGPANLAGYANVTATSGWTWVIDRGGRLIRMSSGNRASPIDTVDLSGLDPESPGLVASVAGTVWVADEDQQMAYVVEGIANAPTNLRLAGSVGTVAMAAGPDTVWFLRKDGSLTQVNTTSHDQKTVRLDAPATGVVVGSSALWLLDAGARTIRSVDGDTGGTLRTLDVGGQPAGAVEAGGSLWVTVRAP